MRTVYTVNTSNKFAALSNSDDDEVVTVEKKEAREKSTPGAKENPSSLIYPWLIFLLVKKLNNK